MLDLLKAIKEHSGLSLQSIHDAGRYGADGGLSGFIHNTEAAEFFDKNSEIIWDHLTEEAEGMGHSNPMEMVANFGRADMLHSFEGFKVLLAWYVLESVGQWLDNEGWPLQTEDGDDFNFLEVNKAKALIRKALADDNDDLARSIAWDADDEARDELLDFIENYDPEDDDEDDDDEDDDAYDESGAGEPVK